MSQLLIIPWSEEGNICTIHDKPTCHQLFRVLRMRVGDVLFLQDHLGTKRYEVLIEQINAEYMRCNILNRSEPPKRETAPKGMIVALPNKFEKLELIVQKLAEIGIDHLICRPSKRSLLKELPEKKYARLCNIAREATEQSWGWQTPFIEFSPTFPSSQDGTLLLFDYHEHLAAQIPISQSREYELKQKSFPLRGIVGPEGGFMPEEVLSWGVHIDAQICLGDQVLRTETASIVGGWWLKNFSGIHIL